MSAALHEYRQRYRAAQARLWARPPKPVVRDIIILRSGPAWLYDEPIGPRKPTYAEQTIVPRSTHHDAKAIVREVAAKYGITVMDLVSERRQKLLCTARHEAAYRLRHETTWSLPRIGGFLGGRDHTSILNSLKRHEERLRKQADGK